MKMLLLFLLMFQHTAARRRLEKILKSDVDKYIVSTHSRPKAAGYKMIFGTKETLVSTHSRPKAAGYKMIFGTKETLVSTHSRPKAAGGSLWQRACREMFQHTAARRRLDW